MTNNDLEKFLQELTFLLIKYRVGIADSPTLYELDDDDLNRKCILDDSSKLHF